MAERKVKLIDVEALWRIERETDGFGIRSLAFRVHGITLAALKAKRGQK